MTANAYLWETAFYYFLPSDTQEVSDIGARIPLYAGKYRAVSHIKYHAVLGLVVISRSSSLYKLKL